MSTFDLQSISCPHCHKKAKLEIASGINGSRAPRYRTAILQETFQVYTCSKCQHTYQVDQPFIYMDYNYKDWIMVFPFKQRESWHMLEHTATDSFDKACGDQAPYVAQKIGEGMRVRTVFGLLALREKLLCYDYSLDDKILELTKFRLALTLNNFSLLSSEQLRLYQATPEDLIFIKQTANSDKNNKPLTIPREIYEEVKVEQAMWLSVYTEITKGSYVDIARLA